MKILFTRFPLESRTNGGAELQTISLMEGLLKRGNAVAFAGSCPALLELCLGRNIPSTSFEIGPPPVTKWNAVSFAWRKRHMQKKLQILLNSFCHSTANKQRHPERLRASGASRGGVEGHDLDAIVMLSLTEKLLLTPLVTGPNTPILEYSHNPPHIFWLEHDPVGRWLTQNPWLPQLLRLSKNVTIITVSELSRALYIHMGFDPDRVVAIPNGIDLSRFSSAPPASSVSSASSLKIGTIARLEKEKGLDLLLQSIRDLPNVSLTIVGTGREEANLRNLMRTLPHPDRVHLAPNVPNLGTFYRSIDLLVLPSRTNDPFGLVAAEAMSLGVPVMVTDACGIAAYLKHDDNAVIVKADDVSALRDGIRSLLDQAKRASIAEKGRMFARTEFSLEKMTERYETLLKGKNL